MANPAGSAEDEQLQLLLQQFLEANNEARVAAEKTVTRILRQPTCVGALLKQIAYSTFPGVRQLASILLRKKISLHWKKLAEAEKQGVQDALLARLLEEPEKLVRTAVAHLISVVGKLTIPVGKWNALLPFLLQCTKSENPNHREIAMILLYALTETVQTQMQPHLNALVDVFLGGLSDAHAPVRMATLRAVVPVIGFVEREVDLQVYMQLLPPIMEVLKQCIQLHHETEEEQYLDVVLQVFEVFDDLASIDLQGSAKVLLGLLESMVGVASNTNAHPVIRERATAFIGDIVAEKPNLVVKRNLVEPILKLALSILTEQYEAEIFDNDQFDDDDDHNASALQFSSQLMDQMACSLPNSKVYPLVFGWCRDQILGGQGNPPTVKAAILAIGLICKGCRDPMRKEIDVVLEMINRCLTAAEPLVREAGCIGVSQVVEYLQPEILEKYDVFLPQVFRTLDDPAPKVRQKCVFALEGVSDNLSDKIAPYLPELMAKLLKLLEEGEPKTQQICIGSISSLADGAGEGFQEYAPHVLGIMKQIMENEDDAHLVLRARATECVGVIAVTMGRDKFHPYFDTFFPLAMKGLELDFTELDENTYGFLKNLAEVYGEDWAAQLPVCIPIMLEAIEQEDGQTKGSKCVFGNTNIELSDSEGEEDESDSDDEATRMLQVRAADLDKKAAAIHAVGVFARVTKAKFAPYLDKCAEAVMDMLVYFHDSVRENVIFAIRHLTSVPYHMHPPSEPWQKGLPQNDSIHPTARAAIGTTLTLYLQRAEEDESKEVVKAICDSIVELAKEMGPVAIHTHIDAIMKLLLSLMKKEAYCYASFDEEEDNLEDEEDHEQILIDAVFETVDELAKVYAGGFAQMWPPLLEAVLVYLSPKRSPSDHIMALGTLAEVANCMGEAIQPFFPKMFPVMLQFLRSDDAGTRSNAAYGVGVMCQYCTLQATPHFGEALQGLRPCMELDRNPRNCVDNACGAVARLLAANLEACHFDQVFPALIQRLPLQHDWQENPIVYSTVCTLLARIPDQTRPYLEHLLKVFVHVLRAPDLETTPEVKQGVAAYLKGLLSSDEHAQQLAGRMTEEEQAVLRQVM